MRTADTIFSIFLIIAGIALFIWLINFLRNRNGVTVVESDEIRREYIPMQQYAPVQQPVFSPSPIGVNPVGMANAGARVGNIQSR